MLDGMATHIISNVIIRNKGFVTRKVTKDIARNKCQMMITAREARQVF